MNVTFAPMGILQIDDARIVYRNFSGEGSMYNREGDRNFSVIIPDQEIKDALVNEGWNVKTKPPRDEDDTPFMHLPVKVKFNEFGPNVHLIVGNKDILLDEDSIHRLDRVSISHVDLDIRPYDWEINGKEGRTAYLQSIRVFQDERYSDRFAGSYED